MDDGAEDFTRQTGGVTVEALRGWHLGALRHFDAAVVGARLADLLGGSLPGPLQALLRPAIVAGDTATGELRLLWRNPTETWLLCPDARWIEAVQTRLAGASDACIVDQTGGIRVLRLAGERVRELLVRMTSIESIPGPGCAVSGRWADVGCVAAAAAPGEFWLLVERVYLDHVGAWIDATLKDL
jgi:sarcosine oxidase gamma subunit